MLTFEVVKDVHRPIGARHAADDRVELGDAVVRHESVPEQPERLVRPDVDDVSGIVAPAPAPAPAPPAPAPTAPGQVVAQQAEGPARQVARREHVVAVLVDGEARARLRVHLHHGGGEGARPAARRAPHAVPRPQLGAEHRPEVRRHDLLQLVLGGVPGIARSGSRRYKAGYDHAKRVKSTQIGHEHAK